MGGTEELQIETVAQTDEQLNLLRPCKSPGLSGQADTSSVSINFRGSRNSATTLHLHESARLETESRPEQSPSNWTADWTTNSMGEVRPALTETRVHVFQFLWMCCKYLERDVKTKKQRQLRCSHWHELWCCFISSWSKSICNSRMMLLSFWVGLSLYAIPKRALQELEGPQRLLPLFE